MCFSYYSDATGKFPDYPADDEGGSAAIFKERDPAEVEAEMKAKVGFPVLFFFFYYERSQLYIVLQCDCHPSNDCQT